MIMFLPLLVAFQASRYVPATNARELARVRTFLREAYIGLDSADPLPYFDRQGEPKVDVRDEAEFGFRAYEFLNATVCIDEKTGRIQRYWGNGEGHATQYPDGTLTPRRVSDGDAGDLARRFLAASGRLGEFKVTGVQDFRGDNDQDVQVDYVPATGGVPYLAYGGQIDLDRQTGRLDRFSPAYDLPPDPPKSLKPDLSLESARAIALKIGLEKRGEPLAIWPKDPFRLVVWTPLKPSKGKVPAWYFVQKDTLGIRAALAAHRGILAYSGWFRGKTYESSLLVVVDAHTGEVLGTQDPTPSGTFG